MQISSYKLMYGCAVILAVLCSVALGEQSLHDCYPLQIKNCTMIEFEISCLHLPEKTPDALVLDLFCHNGRNIEVLDVKYSMPALPSLICSEEEKRFDCTMNLCQCCTVPDKVCSVDSHILLDKMSKTCNNVTTCSVTIPRFEFRKTDCPLFTWPKPGEPEGHCDNTPDQCYSRWIDITYMCHIPQNQTSSMGNDLDFICPSSLGSNPIALPILGDNWANFQMNFTFPCDGSIKQIRYHQSVPNVPVYLGIWRTKSEGNLLLKHKVKLQSDTMGLVHRICDPPVAVESGDFIGIHHTMVYQHSVIPHTTNQDSQLYDTLVVEVFDEDMKEGKELSLSGRKRKAVNKEFAIQMQIGIQTFDSLTTSSYVGASDDNHLTCPLSLGSKPTALRILGDDNWSNFQLNFTFPCDGSIKQIHYHRSVPKVPVYVGIWHTKPGGNLLLKHKIKLQSDALGLVHKVCDPAIEVKSGDFVGIHHTMGYHHNVIPHNKTSHGSQLYHTLVVEIFDKDLSEGEGLDLSERNTKVVSKAFAIELQIGYSNTSTYRNKNNLSGKIGVIIGVTVAAVVAIATITVTVISLRKIKQKKPVVEPQDVMYLNTSGINPFSQSINREESVEENSTYLVPLKQPIAHHHPSGIYQEIRATEPPQNITTQQYEDVALGISSKHIFQPSKQVSEGPKKYVSVFVKNLTGVQSSERSVGTSEQSSFKVGATVSTKE